MIRSGFARCALYGALAVGCSEPYKSDPQFWPTDGGGFGTGGSGTGGDMLPNSGGSASGGAPLGSGGFLGSNGGSTAAGTGPGAGSDGGAANLGGSPTGNGGSLGTGGFGTGGSFGNGGFGTGSFGTGGSFGAGGSLSGGRFGNGGSAESGGSFSTGGGAGGLAGSGGSVSTAGSNSSGGGTSTANCSLTVNVTTAAAGGRYAPKNIGAIWIADQSGNFVRSIEVWAQQRARDLTMWNSTTSKAGAPASRVDIVSQATLTSHKAHTATWNCQNFSKAAVPDGTYRVYMELNDGSGANRFETFTKGPAEATLTPADNNNFKSIKLSFKP